MQNELQSIQSKKSFALFNEKLRHLNLSDKKVLVIKGNNESDNGSTNLAAKYPNWTVLDVYTRNMLPIDKVEFNNYLSSNELRGIIITTSTLVGWLFKEAERVGCANKLKNCLFIVLHPQIEKKLINCGAGRILVTNSATRDAVVGLIRSLYDN